MRGNYFCKWIGIPHMAINVLVMDHVAIVWYSRPKVCFIYGLERAVRYFPLIPSIFLVCVRFLSPWGYSLADAPTCEHKLQDAWREPLAWRPGGKFAQCSQAQYLIFFSYSPLFLTHWMSGIALSQSAQLRTERETFFLVLRAGY
jgi:hypothetical protein